MTAKVNIPCWRHFAEKADNISLSKTFSSFITLSHLSRFFVMFRRCCGKQVDDEGGAKQWEKKRKNGNFMASSLYAEHRRAEVVKSYVNVISSSGDVKYVLLILLSRNRLARTRTFSRNAHFLPHELHIRQCDWDSFSLFLMNRF